jgi:two-component system phosphate regulon sensor histidine kinase PhoR
VETLQDGAAEDPEVRTKFLDIIAIEAARLKRLIEDILIISDIENKREANTDSDINVRESIEEILASMEPIIESKHAKVVTSYAYEIYIGGNPDRFKQLMVNLIENAVKYSYDGGTVWVNAEKKDGKVQISVRDEGIGIPEESLPRIFERFYRVDILSSGCFL